MAWEKIYSKVKLKTDDKYSERFTVGEVITKPEQLLIYKLKLDPFSGVMYENVVSVYSSHHRRPLSMTWIGSLSFRTVVDWIGRGYLFELIPNADHPKNKKYFPQVHTFNVNSLNNHLNKIKTHELS